MDKGQILLFAGTKKGLFIFRSDADRRNWRVTEPHFPGWAAQHTSYDPRNGMIYVALDHMVYGSNIHRSPDLGKSWEICDALTYGEEQKAATRIWHIQSGHPSQPDVVWAGGDPGLLFKSEDAGKSWAEVPGINRHPTREAWFPGAGGQIVHTIVQHPTDPQRLYVAVSAAGVFRSDDGGVSWQPKNKGVAADFLPDPNPTVGQCCHHLVMSPTNPNWLFQQNHCGVYRSYDGGDSWEDVGEGLPATFGFPMGINSQQAQTIYVIPQISPDYRYTPEGKFRVYRSTNGGGEWEALTNGLPQENAYLACYREGMATDGLNPCGIYAGTTTGQLFYSRNNGDDWETLSTNLPPIYALGTATLPA